MHNRDVQRSRLESASILVVRALQDKLRVPLPVGVQVLAKTCRTWRWKPLMHVYPMPHRQGRSIGYALAPALQPPAEPLYAPLTGIIKGPAPGC